MACPISDNHRTDMDNNGGVAEEKRETGYKGDKPPEDDCCPICFGNFTVPCKANCGHWFCGSCILQLWKHLSRPWEFSCPFCRAEINRLAPQVSAVDTTEAEVVEVRENIEYYNSLYIEGNESFIRNLTIDLIQHPERLGAYVDLECIKIFILGFFIPIFHVMIFGITMAMKWTLFAHIVVVSICYMGRSCCDWINIQRFTLQMRQFKRESNAMGEQEVARQAHGVALRADSI